MEGKKINGGNRTLLVVLNLDGRIHMGRLEYTPGGVGRNICEAMGKLGRNCHFISAVGDDEQGRILTRNLSEESRKCIKICRDNHSAQCIVVLDKNGNCSFLMGDMNIHNQITPEMIEYYEDQIKQSPLLIIDGNLSIDAMEKTLQIAHYHAIPGKYI
ncbi:hypothetical protein GWI33_018723 [Rhynchophorus ferrugineus]|uniref:Carbohydrate kinase PfkB domain-containing protein n=1 Tax=Rhynchophorus ferrugineus TaxID=354439 RepID=A0A834HWB7_RHYFE|nr:hypothetical protein GWI33_018723 [Rhynchophorus ferrugineus]